MAIELAPHQIKAVREMQNGSLLKGGVGTGKSRTALYYWFTRVAGGSVRTNGQGSFRPPDHWTDLYIITTAKKRDELDWNKEIASFGLQVDPGWNAGGLRIVVDSWNNVSRYVDRRGAFFIFDEQRLVGSGAWVKAFLTIAASNKWIMLSATPGDNWLDYIPVFIAHGFYKNRTEFLRRHVVFNHFQKFPKVDHYVEEGKLTKLRHQIIVEMPYKRHTVRHSLNLTVPYDKAKYERVSKDRWHVYEDRPIRDVGELFGVMRKVSNDNPHRLAAVMQILEKHPRLIIFYNFNYELEMLRTLKDVLNIKTAEWNGHKHESVPEGDRWIYLVQYAAGAEGWNCVTTDAICFYSLTYSYKHFEQSKGRIDRLNTPYKDLYYHVLRSGAPIDQMIWKALLHKENFSEAKVGINWS